MQQADFIHLVRLSEQECAQDAQAYRRTVWRYAVLGYAFIALLGLGALATLTAVVWLYRSHGFSAALVVLGLGAATMLWVSVSALVTRFDMPEGYILEKNDAPELFRAISRIRRTVKGPKIDLVLVDQQFNAAIVQKPRWGLFGHTNILIIGWPMLCALEPRRLFAVIAHEYGHLRGDHGKFAAWIYRTRAAWWRLYTAYEHDESPASWLLRRLFGWYIPRFNARSFALAREDEYEADRIAAKLLTPEVVGSAWNEITIKSRWHDQHYWGDVWRRAARQDRPEPMPFADMMRKLRRRPDESFAQEALRQSLKQLPTYDDTHPVARDRLAALGVKPGIPEWSRKQAVQLLGPAATRIAAYFDDQWWADNRREWARSREQLKRCLERIQALKTRATQLSADEWVDWAECFEALSSDDSSVLYEHALHRDANHPTALRRLAQRRVDTMHPDALSLFERLQQAHPQHGFAACTMALEWMDRRQHAGFDVTNEQRRWWRERREHFEKLEDQAWDEFSSGDPCEHTQAPECTDGERRQIVDALIRMPVVKAAWLAGKQSSKMPGRAYLVLYVELTRKDEALARGTSATLTQMLPFEQRLLVTVVDVFVQQRDLDRTAAISIYRRQGQ